ncbi:adenylate/guanylate cyclase domain-containing protein [Roseicella aquatilis]|uniref:Adenylate cyclase n=1 Tax=Roseicella aquatilis TaxID=2527868 RepID=A0A4R4DUR3_9PROT|nr:adenylate/guanylate cyclase domain-containing protein [Roseicella aquatilis]TCZ66003.1 adenylate cyclase [Roseicella aquatilis]
MTEVGAWLRDLGLGQYAPAFAENHIDAGLLPSLTADDLRELGVASIGHRRRLLQAIAALGEGGEAAAPPAAAASPEAPMDIDPVGGAAAERRRVTVLFCDLAESTALSARLDPEDLRAAMAAYHQAVAATVEAQGGYVAKFLGDGVLAYFGWPRAREEDAERAVRAGLAALRAVAALDLPAAGRMVARVGIATGEVVVGDLLGAGAARERTVVGATPNLAARLQALAPPGAVLACPETRRLTGTLFDWEALPPLVAKGLDAVAAFRALRESGVESRFEALRQGHAAPLVGREEELELLLRRWRRARAGDGQVVLLRGEPGIGKSRLAAALREALAAGGEPHQELTFYGSPQHTDSALQPLIARLERNAGFGPADAPETRLAKLEALLLPLDPPPEDVALVAELLLLPNPGRWPMPDLLPQRRREALLAALLRRTRSLAAQVPVLALVEDAHWLDPSTRDFIDLLVAEAPGMAVLLVVTHRPEFDTGAWLGQAHVTPIQVNRLAPAENAALLRRVAGGRALPPEVEAEILARTDGVPLFVEEVARAVLEGGLLREAPDRWVLEGPLPPLAVPGSLQASLMARLDRSAAVREVAQAGAVLGREFTHDLVAAVAGLPALRLAEGLAQLEATGLLRRIGTPPESRYSFKHALVQDAASGILLRERRRELHRRAAEAIERLRPEVLDREPETLAHHRAEAGELRAAIELYRRAGEQSAARSSLREARAQFTAALDLLAGLPQDAWRDRKELALQVPLAGATTWVEGQAAPAAGRVYARARQLCHQLGETERLIPVLAGLAVHHTNRGEPEAAGAMAEEMLDLALAQGDAAAELSARRLLGYALVKQGRPGAARTCFERVLASFDPARHRVLGSGFPMDTRIGALSWLANTLLILGHPEQALARGCAAVAEARGLEHIQSLTTALVAGGCSLHCLARDPAATLAHAEELETLSARAPAFRHVARIYRGWALSLLAGAGPEEGLARMQEALADYRASGAGTVVPQALGLMAEGQGRLGCPGRGLPLLDEALALVERGGERIGEAELHRIRGELLLALPGGEAEPWLRRALEVARAQGARLWELRAATSLARLWHDRGRPGEARDLLAPVLGWFTEGLAWRDLAEARELLRALDAASGPVADRRAAGR